MNDLEQTLLDTTKVLNAVVDRVIALEKEVKKLKDENNPYEKAKENAML